MKHFSICVLMLMCLGPNAAGQEQPGHALFDGPDIFGMILRFEGLSPISPIPGTFRWNDSPDKTLLVVFGDLRCLDKLDWQDFLEQGGSMLLASDVREENRLDDLGISIVGDSVRQPADGAYRNDERCPLIDLASHLAPKHPLLSRMPPGKRLATNRPSQLTSDRKNSRFWVAFPRDCLADQAADEQMTQRMLYMVGSPEEAPPSGRVLVLAGQGVFLNCMLLPDDNVNFQFAWNCVRWLKEGPKGSRTRVLFVNNGEPVKAFFLPLSLSPKMPGQPPIPASILADRLLRHIEDERILQQILEENFGLGNILQALLLAATAGLLFYSSWRLARGMLRVDTSVPLLIEPIPAAKDSWTALDLRREALAEIDRCGEPAQALARQWFFAKAGVAPMSWDEAGFRLPSFQVSGSMWQRWRTNWRIRYLAKVARQGAVLTGRRFRRFCGLLRQLGDDARWTV